MDINYNEKRMNFLKRYIETLIMISLVLMESSQRDKYNNTKKCH